MEIAIILATIALIALYFYWRKPWLGALKELSFFIITALFGGLFFFGLQPLNSFIETKNISSSTQTILEQSTYNVFPNATIDNMYEGYYRFDRAFFIDAQSSEEVFRLILEKQTGEILYEGSKKKWYPEVTVNDTQAPELEILFPEDGQVFQIDEIEVHASATDDIDEEVLIEGTGTFKLEPGFNTIILTATDKAGNAVSEFVVVEKK